MAKFTTLATLASVGVNVGLTIDAAGNLLGTQNTNTDGLVFTLARSGTGYGTRSTLSDLGANSALTYGLTVDEAGNLFASGRAVNGQAAMFEFVNNGNGSYTPTVLSYSFRLTPSTLTPLAR